MEKNGIDLHRVLLEIDEEVRAKRASGEIPSDLERELDLAFARFAPTGAIEGDFDSLLQRAESQSFFDLLAPTESVKPGVPYIKRFVQKTVRWYMRYVAEQVTSFANTIVKAIRQLSVRVTALEQLYVPTDEYEAVIAKSESPYDTSWDDKVVKAFENTTGRVLHARCGAGGLVQKLRSAGVDAYGVDPSTELVSAGATEADLRPDDELNHLRKVAIGALEGLVLTGSIDTLARGAQIELIELASTALSNQGMLVIVCANPRAWEDSQSPLEVDLASGRPLHAETWKYLLEERGFVSVEIEYSSPNAQLKKTKKDDAFNENIDLLNSLLFPPKSSLVIAKR